MGKWGYVFVLLLLSTVMASHAAIRVYNPQTGESESATTFEGASRPEAPQILTNPEPEQKLAPLPIIERDTTLTPETNTSLGKAIFFIDFRKFYNAKLARELKEVQKIRGLETSFYMESKDPKEYAQDVIRAQKNKTFNIQQDRALFDSLPKVKADLHGDLYAYHRPGGWHKVVYYDGTGSRRVYSLDYDIEKFLRHVQRIQRAKGQK